MLLNFNKELFFRVHPMTLRQFYEKVLGKPLPTIAERGMMFEEYGLGPADEFIGTAGQNQAILEMLYLLAEQDELP